MYWWAMHVTGCRKGVNKLTLQLAEVLHKGFAKAQMTFITARKGAANRSRRVSRHLADRRAAKAKQRSAPGQR